MWADNPRTLVVADDGAIRGAVAVAQSGAGYRVQARRDVTMGAGPPA